MTPTPGKPGADKSRTADRSADFRLDFLRDLGQGSRTFSRSRVYSSLHFETSRKWYYNLLVFAVVQSTHPSTVRARPIRARPSREADMFICYSQNFEDVLLWRALKDVPNGFYIDVGAQDPRIHSVSRGFYEQGWRGFSVEPTQTYADKLRADRPDERIIQAAIGAGGEDITFFEFPDTGLSTADATIAQMHRDGGFPCVETVVPVLPLDQLLRDARRRDIHWLKIDVEGLEASVLESWGECEIRPWIVVIESTEPMAQTPTHEAWESALLTRGYRFVHFDGLNRYYVSDSQADRARFFGPGVNYFDDFEISLHGHAAGASGLREALRRAEAEANALRNDLDQVTTERDALSSQRDALATECDRMIVKFEVLQIENHSAREVELLLAATRASTSWRVTAPLRVAKRAVRGDFESFKRLAAGQSGTVGVKRAVRAALAKAAPFVRERPAFKRATLAVLALAPPLRDRLLLALQNERTDQAAIQRQTYSDYALAIEPVRLAEWRTLVGVSTSDGKTS